MSSTRLLTQEFEYMAPGSLKDALDLLSSGNDGIRILAGGTDLLVKMKTGKGPNVNMILDTRNLSELSFISKKSDGMEIGSLTKLATLEKDAAIRENLPALADALPLMASVAVRNMGTIGGNLGNASPAADTACPLIVHNSLVNISSAEGDRQVPVHEFFKAPGLSVLNPEEMIVSIWVPASPANSSSAFLKKTRVRPDISKISVAAYIERDGNRIADCRIAMGSVAATPLRLNQIADQAIGQAAGDKLFADIAAKISAFIRPIDDNRSTAEYRKAITVVLVREALETAWTRTGGAL